MTSQVNVLHMCQNAKTLIIIDDNGNAKFTEYLLVVFSKFLYYPVYQICNM